MAELTPVASSADEPSPKSGQLKPIMPPWTLGRAEFASKVSDLGKRAAHAALWHLWHDPANILRVLWSDYRRPFATEDGGEAPAEPSAEDPPKGKAATILIWFLTAEAVKHWLLPW